MWRESWSKRDPSGLGWLVRGHSTSLAGSQADYDFDPKSVQGYQERTTFTDAARGAGAASMQHVRQSRGLVPQRVCAQAQRVGLAPERVSAYVRHGARRAR